MFGFGKGPQKNASDIQLAIDAIDIAFTKPAVERFVIVSGDGAFSALAKKLHEYGKMVIGCAYRKTANRIFEAVCDDFIWIEEPKDDEEIISESKAEFTDPILIAFAKKYQQSEIEDREAVFGQARKILHFFKENRDAAYLLKNVGMNISIYNQALTYNIKGFNYLKYGFTRFVDFIRYIVRGTDIKLVHNPPSEYRLLIKDRNLPDFIDVKPLEELSEIHTADNYLQLLSKGSPIFRLPSFDILYQVTQFLSENKMEFCDVYLGDIIERISANFEYEQKDIKGAVLSLVSADCFIREPEDKKLSEQKLSFKCNTTLDALNALRNAMHNKLEQLLGSVDESEFEKIIQINS